MEKSRESDMEIDFVSLIIFYFSLQFKRKEPNCCLRAHHFPITFQNQLKFNAAINQNGWQELVIGFEERKSVGARQQWALKHRHQRTIISQHFHDKVCACSLGYFARLHCRGKKRHFIIFILIVLGH
jgi:hypothetical protein